VTDYKPVDFGLFDAVRQIRQSLTESILTLASQPLVHRDRKALLAIDVEVLRQPAARKNALQAP
jgi:hypothetical protein